MKFNPEIFKQMLITTMGPSLNIRDLPDKLEAIKRACGDIGQHSSDLAVSQGTLLVAATQCMGGTPENVQVHADGDSVVVSVGDFKVGSLTFHSEARNGSVRMGSILELTKAAAQGLILGQAPEPVEVSSGN